MKKIYLLALATFVCLGGFAQNQNLKQSGVKLHVPLGTINKHTAEKKANRTATPGTFFIDYDEAEFQLVGGTPETPAPSQSYRRFIWDVNWNYTLNDSSTKYFTVAFDSLYDYVSGSTYSLGAGEVLTIDSIFVGAGHEKNTASTVNDTVLFRFMNTTGAYNYPGNTTYTTVSVVTNTNLGATNNWLGSTVIAQKVNYTLAMGNSKFACRLEYRGNKMDTLGVLAGFFDAGGPCTAGNPYRAQRSFYYPNSYRLITQYAFAGPLPQVGPGHGDIYYDCDGSGTLDPTVDGRNFTQNVSMWAKVTISLATGIKELQETGVALSQNMPNPYTGSSIVKYQLAKDANSALFTVTDVTGRVVSSEKVATSTGIHTVNLGSYAAGVYYYSLNVDGTVTTKKMIVE